MKPPAIVLTAPGTNRQNDAAFALEQAGAAPVCVDLLDLPGRRGEIERATKAMAKASKGRLPVVYRTDVVEACRGCEYAQKCLGERAVASHFPIVDPRPGELFAESEGGLTD